MKKLSALVMAILLALTGAADLASAETAVEPFSLWNPDAAAVNALEEYLAAVTDELSPDYIPVRDRIAVFDLDGTLMCETDPFCFEYMVFADYAMNHADEMPEDVMAVAQEILDAAGGAKPSGMSTRQAAAAAVCKRRAASAARIAAAADTWARRKAASAVPAAGKRQAAAAVRIAAAVVHMAAADKRAAALAVPAALQAAVSAEREQSEASEREQVRLAAVPAQQRFREPAQARDPAFPALRTRPRGDTSYRE